LSAVACAPFAVACAPDATAPAASDFKALATLLALALPCSIRSEALSLTLSYLSATLSTNSLNLSFRF